MVNPSTETDDQLSWEAIVTEHSARVYRLAYRLTGNRHDAEDLTQEVFVRVFRSLHTYTPGTMAGWYSAPMPPLERAGTHAVVAPPRNAAPPSAPVVRRNCRRSIPTPPPDDAAAPCWTLMAARCSSAGVAHVITR